MNTSVFPGKGPVPSPKEQIICKGYGATVRTLMKSIFMCMVPLHWRTPVLGQLLSYVNGYMLWFASLSRADTRFGPISVGPFRHFLSKGFRNTIQSSDRFVSLAK